MFVHLVIHYPKPEHTEDLLNSMRKVDAAAQGAPGLVRIGPWRDERGGRLVGLALWDSAEAYQASAERIFEAVADDPIPEWCERAPEVFHLTEP